MAAESGYIYKCGDDITSEDEKCRRKKGPRSIGSSSFDKSIEKKQLTDENFENKDECENWKKLITLTTK